MENIYVCSKKISGENILNIFISVEPMDLMKRLSKFLTFSSEIDCSDCDGSINFNLNMASNHFLIFEKDRKHFFESISSFCQKENIFLLNTIDTDELLQKEKIFMMGNKKTKSYIKRLKEDYEKYKSNKDVIKMARCIKEAERVIFGKVKIG